MKMKAVFDGTRRKKLPSHVACCCVLLEAVVMVWRSAVVLAQSAVTQRRENSAMRRTRAMSHFRFTGTGTKRRCIPPVSKGVESLAEGIWTAHQRCSCTMQRGAEILRCGLFDYFPAVSRWLSQPIGLDRKSFRSWPVLNRGWTGLEATIRDAHWLQFRREPPT